MNGAGQRCPCGSGLSLEKCCGPLISANATAASAEALMRSRYTAFTLRESTYLLTSWHSSTRPPELNLAEDDTEWQGLTILKTSTGRSGECDGMVEFVARYRQQGKEGALHERSRFLHEDGRWFYLDGEIEPNAPMKVGRNAPCPCGSGKKFKRCCGASR